jgi:hypothetical protein
VLAPQRSEAEIHRDDAQHIHPRGLVREAVDQERLGVLPANEQVDDVAERVVFEEGGALASSYPLSCLGDVIAVPPNLPLRSC